MFKSPCNHVNIYEINVIKLLFNPCAIESEIRLQFFILVLLTETIAISLAAKYALTNVKITIKTILNEIDSGPESIK